MPKSKEDSIEHINLGEPDLGILIEELDRSLVDSAPYLDQYRFDYQTRFDLWAGQTREGRKFDSNLGGKGKARPWNGASDVRTFTADAIVIEHVELMMAAWRRANIQVTARQSAQLDWSTKVTNLLSWLFRDLIPQEVDCELELVAQWRQTFGVSAMGIWWNQERSIEWQDVSLDEMIQRAEGVMQQTGDQAAIEGIDKILDPLEEEGVIQSMMEINPVLDRQGARKFLRDLRTTGEAKIPKIYIGKNQPCWEALRPWLDIFFPVETCSFRKDCRWTARRRWMTETQLSEKVETEGWDREWVTAMLERKGQSYGITETIRDLAPSGLLGMGSSSGGSGGSGGQPFGGLGSAPSAQDYFEVFDQIYTGLDQKTGVPILMRTVYSPHEKDLYAKHEVVPFSHKSQPYIDFVRERVERPMVESRSVPEIAATFQRTIKTQRDAANDLAQASTLPTLVTPMWRSGSKVEFGPGAQIPERTAGELRFLQVPQNSILAEKIDQNTEIALAKYFGLNHEAVTAERKQLAAGHLVGKFLSETNACCRMTFQLCQQYMDDVEAERVVGAMRVPFKATREEIQGAFTMRMSMDPNDLNFDMAIRKIEAFNKFVIPTDTTGVVNRGIWTKFAARMLDPDMADELVGDPEQAAQGEVEDEKRNLAMILSGVEPPMVKEGQNYALRAQALQGHLQSNPILPLLIQQRPDVQAMLQARMQHLQFMVEQFGINAETGRVGAEPGLKQLSAQGSGGAEQ